MTMAKFRELTLVEDPRAAAEVVQRDELYLKFLSDMGLPRPHAKPAGNAGEKRDYHTITEAKAAEPDLDVAVISVMGEFAAREARIALENSMHVMLFSDNVTVEQELEIKQMAHERGLLVMGPDCGTAILGGVGTTP